MYIYIYVYIYIYIYVYINIYTYLYICSAHFASGNWTIGLPFLVPLRFLRKLCYYQARFSHKML